MSIAVGFQSGDAVVLCADRQVTKEGGLKFEEPKIMWRTGLMPEPFSIAFAYCGIPDVAENLFHQMKAAFPEVIERSGHLIEDLRTAIQPFFNSKDAKYVESLIAVGTEVDCFLLRTKNNQIVRGFREYIGSGDSSVLRYLADVMKHVEPSVEQTKALAAYMVFVASRYIDGCGLGGDMVVLRKNQPLVVFSSMDIEQYAAQFIEFEREAEKTFLMKCSPR